MLLPRMAAPSYSITIQELSGCSFTNSLERAEVGHHVPGDAHDSASKASDSRPIS
jgi:hypothetical protein